MGTPSWAGPLTTSLRGLWVSGYLPRARADRAQGRRPDNGRGGDDSDLGLASRRESDLGDCHKRSTLKPGWTASMRKGAGGPKTPLCEGQGPENPGVVAPFAVASCRGNRRYDVLGRSHMSAFSRPSQRPSSELSTLPSLNDDVTHAIDVLIVGKLVPVSLSVVLLVVGCLPSVIVMSEFDIFVSSLSTLRSTKHRAFSRRNRLGWLRRLRSIEVLASRILVFFSSAPPRRSSDNLR